NSPQYLNRQKKVDTPASWKRFPRPFRREKLSKGRRRTFARHSSWCWTASESLRRKVFRLARSARPSSWPKDEARQPGAPPSPAPAFFTGREAHTASGSTLRIGRLPAPLVTGKSRRAQSGQSASNSRFHSLKKELRYAS